MLRAVDRIKTRAADLYELLLLSVLLLIFSWFIHAPVPLGFISFLALVPVGWIISNHYPSVKRIGYQVRSDILSRRMLLFNMVGLQLGTVIAFYYRYTYQMNIWPQSAHWFLVTGIAIAVAEECLFRGIVQSIAERIHYNTAPFAGALIHTAYKVTIFIPLALINPNLYSLFIGSFISFVGLGYLKQISRSIVPAIIAHVVFDVLVYAEYTSAPWWVW